MIDILLSVFNGEKYLAEQINSILSQTCQDWRLVIRDDGSNDKSQDIAQGYADKYPDKIVFINDGKSSGSAKAGFFRLLEYVGNYNSDYIMFCDQDDIWLPEKVSSSLERMQSLEKEHGNNFPILVHSDLNVVNAKLEMISPSFFKYQGLSKKSKTFNRILCQNNVTGCTIMINKRVKELCLSVSLESYMDSILIHDWWIALIAAAFGMIEIIDSPLILYRQHGNNELGAKNAKSLKYILKMLKDRSGSNHRVGMTYVQAEAFFNAYKDKLSEDSLEAVRRYISIPKCGKLKRMYLIARYSYRKQSFMTYMGQLFFC